MKRTFCLLAALAVCCIAQAQSDYPNRPVHLVIPFNPGGDSGCVAVTEADACVRVEAGQELLEGSPA